MRWTRIRLAVGGWLAAAAVTASAGDVAPNCPECDRLPPLLPVPALETPVPEPQADSAGPAIEYDRSRLYLPDAVPAEPAVAPVAGPSAPPPDRGWLAPAILLGWSSNAPAPAGFPNSGPLDLPFRPGLKVDAGLWIDAEQTRAVEFGGLYVAQAGGDRTAAFAGGTGVGAAALDWAARFASADLGVRREVYREKWPVVGEVRVNGTAGYRFAYLGEDLAQKIAVGGTLTQAGVNTANYFHGAEVGLAGGWWWGYWSLDFAGRVGLGAVVLDVTQSSPGLPTASGSDTRFGVFPAVSATVGRRFGDHTRLFAGYTFQYLSGVGRPGGPPTEVADFRVQGVNLGVEWGY